MKKLILFIVILTLLPLHFSVAQEGAPLSGVMLGSATTTENFNTWSGGLQVGFEYGIDQKAGVSLRTLYTRWRFGDPNLQTIRANAKWNWYAGKNISFYLLAGADAWIDGVNNGADLMTGIGFGWNFYTAKGDEWLVPFSISLLSEVVFADADTPTDNTGQINIGFRFTRPIAK